MSIQLKAYLGYEGGPLIFVQVAKTSRQVDLMLYKEGELVDQVYDHTHYAFKIPSEGNYIVVANVQGYRSLYTRTIEYNKKIFSGLTQTKKDYIQNVKKLHGSEPVFDHDNNFVVDVKFCKEHKNDVLNYLTKTLKLTSVREREIKSNGFPSNHSIHNYGYFVISELTSCREAAKLCERIENLEYVCFCSVRPTSPRDFDKENHVKRKQNDSHKAEVTPDFSSLEGHLEPVKGMNVRLAWTKGYTGQNAVSRHYDDGYYANHEDFASANITFVSSAPETSDNNHGTASAGTIASSDNGRGTIGIAYNTSLYCYKFTDLVDLQDEPQAGDILSFSGGITLSSGQKVPVITAKTYWDACKNLTEKGCIVLLAASNGSSDISGLIDEGVIKDYGDSGAILVGAAYSTTGRRHKVSNYNSPYLILNSWGSNVVTTGYGDLQDYDGHNRDYTKIYRHTSAATPLCNGALTILQSNAKSLGTLLTTETVRNLAAQSSYDEGLEDQIGRRLNVDQLNAILDANVLSQLIGKDPVPTDQSHTSYSFDFSRTSDRQYVLKFSFDSVVPKYYGIVCYYDLEGPTELEWASKGSTRLRIPAVSESGENSVVYLKATKQTSSSSYTMNSAYFHLMESSAFSLILDYIADENQQLKEGKYTAYLPIKLTAQDRPAYSQAYKINFKIS